MGGIGLGLNTTSTEHHTHIRTQNTDNKIHTYAHTPANIYMHREQNTICTQSAHNPHTIRTQYAAHRTEHQVQHRTHTEHRTQNRTKDTTISGT